VRAAPAGSAHPLDPQVLLFDRCWR